MIDKYFWPAIALLLGTMCAVLVLSVRGESQTWDEAIHLSAGYSYWKTGDYRMNPEHPPLGKLLNALPLLWMNPVLPTSDPTWQKTDETYFGGVFLYGTHANADRLLFAGRLVTIFLTLCLGLAIALWSRQQFGSLAALLAVLFYSFEPTVIAHGRYITSDLIVTLFSFLACIAWASFLSTGRWSRLVLSGLALGLAVATKFSAFFLLPVFAVLYAIRCCQQRQFPIAHFVKSFTILIVLAAIVLAATYGSQAKRFLPLTKAQRRAQPSATMLRDVVDLGTPTGRAAAWVGTRLGLQDNPLFIGLRIFTSIGSRNMYLLGRAYDEGRWFYFPVAFAVKTPTATLLALLLLFALALRRLRPATAVVARVRKTNLAWFVLAVPILIYGGFALTGGLNIGIRHLLPIYPFLFVLLGAGLSKNLRETAAYVLIPIAILLAVESLSVYPSYLAFFNWAVGGPGNGPEYLIDSNIDWGQDLRHLKSWLDARGQKDVCLMYFGQEEAPGYYGLQSKYIPTTPDILGREPMDCFAAISVTLLHGFYVPPGHYAWLLQREPVAKIGYSIYVYDFRKQH